MSALGDGNEYILINVITKDPIALSVNGSPWIHGEQLRPYDKTSISHVWKVKFTEMDENTISGVHLPIERRAPAWICHRDSQKNLSRLMKKWQAAKSHSNGIFQRFRPTRKTRVTRLPSSQVIDQERHCQMLCSFKVQNL